MNRKILALFQSRWVLLAFLWALSQLMATSDFSVMATAAAQSKIRVTVENGPTLAHFSTYDFGTKSLYSKPEQTFRIWNDGVSTLLLGPIGGGGSGFVPALLPPTSLSPGASGIFIVRFDATYAGNFSSQFSFSTNDPNRSYFTLNFIGAVLGSNMRIEASDGSLVYNGGTHNFPSTTAGVAVNRSFTIRNFGNQTLTINSYTLSTGGGFSTVVYPPTSIDPGATGVFQLRLLSSTQGFYTGTVTLNTNDPVTNPFSFQVRGNVTLPGPKIRIVSGDGVTVGNGSLYTFPSTTKSTPVSRAFTIYNDGDATLTITNPSSLVSGAGFSLIVVPPASIAPGASGVFRVRLLSATAGTYNGSLTIQNNSPTNPFSFSLRGTVN
jgi:Protein of unknown function (DUF1573)